MSEAVMEYETYLLSPHWRKVREQRIRMDGGKCVFCGSNEDLNVHHRSYQNLGNEDVENDLVTMCRKCHETFHKLVCNTSMDDRLQQYKARGYTIGLTIAFCNNVKRLDKAWGGRMDFCNRGVAKLEFDDYLKSLGVSPVPLDAKFVSDFFRNKRYEVVGNMVRAGIDEKGIALRTGFSSKVIANGIRCFRNDEKIRRMFDEFEYVYKYYLDIKW